MLVFYQSNKNIIARKHKIPIFATMILSFIKMEVLAHEAGHNPAAAFSHSENYDYKQKGLQSYRKGWVYPTDKNTTGIIDDDDNRKHMTIK
jgi:hypothetical protein